MVTAAGGVGSRTWLVECYAPGDGGSAVTRRWAVAQAGEPTAATTLLFSILVPGDEVAFHLVAAADADVAVRAAERAGVVPARVVESVLVLPAQKSATAAPPEGAAEGAGFP